MKIYSVYTYSRTCNLDGTWIKGNCIEQEFFSNEENAIAYMHTKFSIGKQERPKRYYSSIIPLDVSVQEMDVELDIWMHASLIDRKLNFLEESRINDLHYNYRLNRQHIKVALCA